MSDGLRSYAKRSNTVPLRRLRSAAALRLRA
jgi:hypothetical protein